MKHTDRPILVPTALSHGVMLWSGVFLLCFGAAYLAYAVWCRYDGLRAALAEPVETPVKTELFAVSVPSDFARYALGDNRLTMFLRRDRAVPLVTIAARRDPVYAYRALDLNPAFIAQRVQAELKDEGVVDDAKGPKPVVLSTVLRHTRHGQPSALAYFRIGAWDGLVNTFYVGDISYLLLALWDKDLGITLEDLRRRLEDMTRDAVWADAPERFLRPVVNSAELDASEHARIVAEVGRERALWKLHAARVDSEPEAALLPAIEHFRRLLSLCASVREERELTESEDFRRYLKFLERRADVVRDWFLLLDKYEAVGDLPAAERQADFIVRHATLEDESLSRRRAARILASVRERLAPKEEN